MIPIIMERNGGLRNERLKTDRRRRRLPAIAYNAG